LASASFCEPSAAADSSDYGFIFDRYQITLENGWRTEAAGPLYYSQQTETQITWALPPFFSCAKDLAVESHEDDFLYPLLTEVRYGREWRWQLFQLISFAGGKQPDDAKTKRTTFFPFYFQQRSPETNLNYTAVFPFYGHLQNRFSRDEIFFILFPFYSETRKRDVVTDNYLFPIGHIRQGDGLEGWQVWPFVGREHKVVTMQTNGFGDVTVIGGHDKSFYLWPLCLLQDTGLGTTNSATFRASIPFYAATRSPQRDSTTVLWPIFSWIDERQKQYHEWQGPWPFVIFARGEGKTTSRVFPLFSQSHNAIKENDSYLWPVYTYTRTHSDPLDHQHTAMLFYLYTHMAEKNTETGAERKRLAIWPFFIWNRDFTGNERLRILAPIEPILPDNRGIERNWSPLWSLWRTEKNVQTGAASQSLLWNLYRRETAPAHKKISLLFGLFQYQCSGENARTKLFYVTVSQSPAAAK
jgi:hypothetical protein